MSIFDKDIVERPVFVPKEHAIRYTLEWTAKNIYEYLTTDQSWRTDRLSYEFCREYMRVNFSSIFEALYAGRLPEERPGECSEYPCVTGYNISVIYKLPDPTESVSFGVLYTVQICYRVNNRLDYIREDIKMII